MGDPSGILGALVEAIMTEVVALARTARRCQEDCNKLVKTLEYVAPIVVKLAQRGVHRSIECEKWLIDFVEVLENAKEVVSHCKPYPWWKPFAYISRVKLSKSLVSIDASINIKVQQVPLFQFNMIEEIYERREEKQVIFEDFVTRPTPKVIVDFKGDVLEKLLTHILSKGEGMEEPMTIGLKGQGGVGKTLLANMVYNNESVQEKFGRDCMIYVTIGRDASISSLYKILAKGLHVEGVFDKEYTCRKEDDQRSYLMEIFLKKKVFLVLDDAWENGGMISWLDIAKGRGSVTLVTTRIKVILDSMKADVTLDVQSLREKESWKLFRTHAFGTNLPHSHEIEKVAHEICAECNGLPLALEVIGSAMWGKEDVRQWQSNLTSLKTSRRTSNASLENRLFNCLRYSYDEMDDASKKCFLYVAAYPEDYEIPIYELCSKWIEDDIFEAFEKEERMQLAYDCLTGLGDRSMIELKEGRSWIKVHDILRDVAIHIIHDANLDEWASRCYIHREQVLKQLSSTKGSYIQGKGEPVEVDRFETPRNGIKVVELQAHASLNSSDEIQGEHGGQSKLKAELYIIDMVYAEIPLDFRATRFEVVMECFIASVRGVVAQVAEFSRLHSGNHIQVFNHECVFLVDTLSGTIHDRLCRYNTLVSLVQVVGVSDRYRILMSVAFCIVALTELERMLKAVVDLLTMCCKEDWWNTALELSNTVPSRTIPRWSSFSLAIRSCEWSMDIVDFGFHALEQFLAGASTVTGVVFKWSDKQSRMVLHIDGKPLYHDEGGSPLLDVSRDLEGKDVTTLIKKLVDLNETRKQTLLKRFSKADANMHSIANVLSQKLHGPRPEPNSVPYTFRVNPSTVKFKKLIATGGFGCVAECKWLEQKVSVKMVKSPGLCRKQFETEAAILATVQHPRVVRMIGCAFEENDGTGSLVMELMEGDLRDVIEKQCPNPVQGVSPFPLRVAIDIMLQICEGMQYLRDHKILHRDLKGKNVLLNKCCTSECGAYGKFPALASLLHSEEYYIVKLADFGIAKARREQTVFKTMMAGTTSWRAPEVFKVPDVETAQNYEWPADVYSFAMTCYEILTGCIPFKNVPNPELYKRIVDGERPPLDDVNTPPLLKDLVKRCWKTDPNERPNFDEICKTLWQCKVENILPAFRLQIDHSETESVAVKAYAECSRASP